MTPMMMGTNCPIGEYRERERQGERESATPIRVWTITGWADTQHVRGKEHSAGRRPTDDESVNWNHDDALDPNVNTRRNICSSSSASDNNKFTN